MRCATDGLLTYSLKGLMQGDEHPVLRGTCYLFLYLTKLAAEMAT